MSVDDDELSCLNLVSYSTIGRYRGHTLYDWCTGVYKIRIYSYTCDDTNSSITTDRNTHLVLKGSTLL